MRLGRRAIVVSVVVGLMGTACGWAGGDGSDSSGAGVAKGGTLKAVLLSDVTAELDPQKEYYAPAWALYRCCLLRTLLSYDVASENDGLPRLRPDLAAGLPLVSKDRRTWRFELKPGLRYAPPFDDVEITSSDFVRALERVADPVAGRGGYAFYYSAIRGFGDFAAGKADSMRGLSTPDDRTLVVKLRTPVNDFGYRMTLPAAAPIPTEAATGHDDGYGRFLVASGPYMFEGTPDLDFTKPAAQQDPVSGYSPGELIVLVRNPSWARASDDLRPAYLDRIEIEIGGDADEAARGVDDGRIDIVLGGAPTSQISRYSRDPDLKDRMFSQPSGTVRYASFNLAVPPFDDVNVRRAVNHVVDKNLLLRVRGGKMAGRIAHHVVPDDLLEGRLEDYQPYASSDSRTGLARAKQEMRASKYDTTGDGVCDGPECRAVVALAFNDDPYPDFASRLEADLETIGIQMDVELTDVGTTYERCSDPQFHIAICLTAGWRADFPKSVAFIRPLFASNAIGPESCCNDSLLGADKRLLQKFGYADIAVPNVDARIERCERARGNHAQNCWAALDQHLMEDVVPWVPFLHENHVDVVSDRLRNYTFDYSTGVVALDHVGMKCPC